jgi:hypothetical protein
VALKDLVGKVLMETLKRLPNSSWIKKEKPYRLLLNVGLN